MAALSTQVDLNPKAQRRLVMPLQPASDVTAFKKISTSPTRTRTRSGRASSTAVASVMNIVFVCTSNTCRSPVAEAFAVDWLSRRLGLTRGQQEAKGIRIQSAAITDAFEKPGSPASMNSIRVMQEYHIDIAAHQSQMLTEAMCREADYVVCVSSGHKMKVLEMFPRVFQERKGVLCTLARDVPDPWHMDYDTYLENVSQVEELVTDFMDKTIKV